MSECSERRDALGRDFELEDFVRLTLSTHSEGAVTDADYAPARRIDEVARG